MFVYINTITHMGQEHCTNNIVLGTLRGRDKEGRMGEREEGERGKKGRDMTERLKVGIIINQWSSD